MHPLRYDVITDDMRHKFLDDDGIPTTRIYFFAKTCLCIKSQLDHKAKYHCNQFAASVTWKHTKSSEKSALKIMNQDCCKVHSA